MRIVTYRSARGDRAGVLRDRLVADAWDALAATGGEAAGPPTVRGLLESGLVEQLADALAADSAADGIPLNDASLRPPIPDPDKIICIGLNYRQHAAEAGQDPPESPTFFAKFRNALAAPGATVALPKASQKVDYEAEVAFVIGRRATTVDASDALAHVAGFTLLNDLSARDLQFATPQWMPGKVFDGSAPCGPALVTADEAGPPDAIEISLTLNGETMQHASTADLIFGVPELVAHLSTLMTLEPGDIVSTGTPPGVGSARKPRVWLKAGDEISIDSPTLGRLDAQIA
jgi:2-keto-4-pentenoate hydratase/2-oxohepta-3-ene-1,7-dioic acid hydratase in catechol pathway